MIVPEKRKGTYSSSHSIPFLLGSRRIGTDGTHSRRILLCGKCHVCIGPQQRRHPFKDKKIRWHIDRSTIRADGMGPTSLTPTQSPNANWHVSRRDPVAYRCARVRLFDCSCQTHLFSVSCASKDVLISSGLLHRYAWVPLLDRRCHPNHY